MRDLQRSVRRRKQRDPSFARGYEIGYEKFKIGILLRQARVEAGLTQEELARKLKTRKSAISRIENHAENLRLSTIEKFAEAIGKRVRLLLGRS